ncbi:hypothetical protein [Candidatus Methanoperedens nitratireducens]|uniref:Uncharacterized protein n=1 Tax=Candidatus Methanoperedens nitratireducens TaxID=1392998 RepID=A0A284VLW1_9EURY|nr:hypothetical protein [Candidatus Methanoperedens nitroreducens]SNQ60238.1 hypothetical protein MNV_1710005 [Candidatus Methanoperedens nitroreducens]
MTELHDILGISEERIAELKERFKRIVLRAKREAEVIVAIEREPNLTLREKLFLAEILGKTVETNHPGNMQESSLSAWIPDFNIRAIQNVLFK